MKTDLRSVLKFTEELQNDRLPSLRVECMHGKLKTTKNRILWTDFLMEKLMFWYLLQ